ncbi:hypothetical protein OAF51_05115, partial [Akkermansiaceae bacterium]|nr:hypothetical protein [Akkermansiaceae bacterium]
YHHGDDVWLTPDLIEGYRNEGRIRMTKQFDRYPGYAGRFLKSRFTRGFNTQQAEGEISVLSARKGQNGSE